MTGGAPIRDLHVIARVGSERFAFAVADVEEAIDRPALEWVPAAPPGLAGQMRHRDRTLTAFDAGWAFGVARDGTASTALVLRVGDRRAVLVVDDVDDLTALDVTTLRPAPAGSDADGVLAGVCVGARHDGQLVNLVRVATLLEKAAATAPMTTESAR
ncbi:MAG: chemotaxis protein CheW [Gemmatimonadetes bacterium]|nr:chemotaxis protein CheW [Gemmatimonadota bacterium]